MRHRLYTRHVDGVYKLFGFDAKVAKGSHFMVPHGVFMLLSVARGVNRRLISDLNHLWAFNVFFVSCPSLGEGRNEWISTLQLRNFHDVSCRLLSRPVASCSQLGRASSFTGSACRRSTLKEAGGGCAEWNGSLTLGDVEDSRDRGIRRNNTLIQRECVLYCLVIFWVCFRQSAIIVQ